MDVNKYAIKFHSQNPQAPEGIPAKWPWLSQKVKPSDEEGFKAAGWTIISDEEFAAHIREHQAAFDGWHLNRREPANTRRLKIMDAVDQKFEHLHPSKIDFRRHLKPNVVLDKRVTMLKNGRPGVAEYFLDGGKVAEIRFDFLVDDFGFMTQRREQLGYVSQDGYIHEYFLIYSQDFDALNPYHARERIRERNDARQLIFDDVKSKLEVFLAIHYLSLGQRYEDVLTMGGAFWEAYAAKISAWVNTGTPALKATLSAESAFSFLDLPIPTSYSGEQDIMSIRDFVISRLTY